MRIGLNLLHARPEIGGGWIYICRLLKALGDFDRDNTYVAFVTNQTEVIIPRQDNFEIVQVAVNPSSRFQRIFYENTRLPRQARQSRLDLVHWFANSVGATNSVPGVASVYDLQVFEKPENFPAAQRIYLRRMFPHTVQKA